MCPVGMDFVLLLKYVHRFVYGLNLLLEPDIFGTYSSENVLLKSKINGMREVITEEKELSTRL